MVGPPPVAVAICVCAPSVLDSRYQRLPLRIELIVSVRKLREEGLDCRDSPGEAAVAVVEVHTEQVSYLCKGKHNLAGAEIVKSSHPYAEVDARPRDSGTRLEERLDVDTRARGDEDAVEDVTLGDLCSNPASSTAKTPVRGSEKTDACCAPREARSTCRRRSGSSSCPR
jgi:hypothetical protein